MSDALRDSVLVTGASGFIGSHLVEELVCRGSRVRAFLHYNSRGDRGLLEGLPEGIVEQTDLVFGDLRDAVSDVLGKYAENLSFSVKPESIKVVQTVEIKEAEVPAE